MQSITLHQLHWDHIRAELESCLPNEGCGLLAGRGRVVEEVHPVTNILQSATAFRMKPEEQVRLLFDFEKRGLDLVGIYHSHPLGPPFPSEIDRRQVGYPGVVHLICSKAGSNWTCQAFRISPSGDLAAIEVEWRE
ncbi:MAG: M67 family metallopeptidase [Anaerolineales bacterium]